MRRAARRSTPSCAAGAPPIWPTDCPGGSTTGVVCSRTLSKPTRRFTVKGSLGFRRAALVALSLTAVALPYGAAADPGKRPGRRAGARGRLDEGVLRVRRRRARPRTDARSRRCQALAHRGRRHRRPLRFPDDARRLAARPRLRPEQRPAHDPGSGQRPGQGDAAGTLRAARRRQPSDHRPALLGAAAAAVLLRDRAERAGAGHGRRLLRTDAGHVPLPDDGRSVRRARRPDRAAGRPRADDDARRPHRRLHRPPRARHDRPGRLRDRDAVTTPPRRRARSPRSPAGTSG